MRRAKHGTFGEAAGPLAREPGPQERHLDLEAVFDKPGREWTDEEREACAGEVFEKRQLYLSALVASRLRPWASAEDVREALNSFWPHFWQSVTKHYDPRKGRRFWSYLNLCLLRHCDHRRQRLKADKTLTIPLYISTVEDEEYDLQIADLSIESDPLRAIEHRDLIQKGLDGLKPESRWLIVEAHLRDRDVVDIAEELGISRTAVRVRLCRARQEMKRVLDALRKDGTQGS